MFHWQFIGFRAIVHVFIWFVNDIVCIPGKNKSSIRNMELSILILSLIIISFNSIFFYSILTLDFVSYFYYFYSHHKTYANSWQYIAHLWEIVNVERGKWTFLRKMIIKKSLESAVYDIYITKLEQSRINERQLKDGKIINKRSCCIYPFSGIVHNLYIVNLYNAFLMKSIYLKMIIKNRAIPDISKNDHINK